MIRYDAGRFVDKCQQHSGAIQRFKPWLADYMTR